MTKTHIFISYKTGDQQGLTASANAIRIYLESQGYDVWMDKSDLVSGEAWTSQIYEAIARSDLLLLLLAAPTADSLYVRREVDVARGAQVFILPVLIREDFDFAAALKQFDLQDVQVERVVRGTQEEYDRLKASIENNKFKTRDRQEKWLEALLGGRANPVFKTPYTPPTKHHSVYVLPDGASDCKIYLAAGDISQMRGIDVLVNPENSYMQMARVFESGTVSSKLRLHGSRRRRSGQIVEDTLQQELYQQITESDEYAIPISMGYVVPTHAGHPTSRLARNKARYVFHVVSVSVDYEAGERSITPIPDERIGEAVANCLDKVIEVDRARGVISPPGTALYAQEMAARDAYEPIDSIIFPLLGTGRGGRQREVSAVARQLVLGIRDYLVNQADPPDFCLKAIYICAYSELDAQLVQAEMDAVLQRRRR